MVQRRDFNETVQAEGTAESVGTHVIAVHDVWGTIKYIIDDGVDVRQGDTLVILDSPSLEEELEDLCTLLEATLAERTKAEATFALEQALQTATMQTAQASASIVALDSLQLVFSPPQQRRISELELQRSAIEQQRSRRSLEAMEIAHRIDMQRLDTFIKHLHRRIADQRQKLAGLVLCAPQDGLVIINRSWATGNTFRVGDEVWDEMPLITLPDISRMQVVMHIPENDYKRVSLGDSVTFTFPSIPESGAWGHITKKMPVGVEAAEGSKVRLFEVTASVDSSLTRLMPQTGTHVAITLQALHDTLVVPAVSVFDADSTRVVYVLRDNGTIEQREVATAASSLGECVIDRGACEGERLLLLRPAAHRVRHKRFLNENN